MAPSCRTLRMCSLSGSPATSTAVSPSALEKKQTKTDNHIKGSFLKRPQVHGLQKVVKFICLTQSYLFNTPILRVYLSVSLSVSLSVGLSVCRSVGLFVYRSFYLSVYLSVFRLSVCLFACQPICRFVD